MIRFEIPTHHWNYFTAIERDLERTSRYVEFSNHNLNTYSIEFTHILLSSSSETDVILKQLCKLYQKKSQPERIDEYRVIMMQENAAFAEEDIFIDRFGLTYKPFENWKSSTTPDWWRSYNRVKHQRNDHFNEANLQNTVNAVGALLISTLYYYKALFSLNSHEDISFKDVTRRLNPPSSFVKANNNYYNGVFLLE